MKPLLLLIGVCGLPALASFSAEPTPLQAKALRHLEAAISTQRGLIQIHAGDALIAAGDPEPVRAAVAAPRPEEESSPVRTGLWRLRAGSASDAAQRQVWLARLETVALDPVANDRLQAIESLAKVGAGLSVPARRALQALADTNGRERPFCLWALLPGGDARIIGEIAALLDSPVDVDRLRSSYILRHLPVKDPAVLAKLAAAALREPKASLAWVYLQGATLALNADAPRADQLRAALWSEFLKGPATARLEAGQDLGRSRAFPEAAFEAGLADGGDAGIGAAWAILALRPPASAGG